MKTYTKKEVVDAIKQWLEAGENECNRAHGKRWGYFSGGGWAATVLRYHLESLQPAVAPDTESEWFCIECKHDGNTGEKCDYCLMPRR